MNPHEIVGFAKFWADYGTVAAFVVAFAAVGLIWVGFKVKALVIQTEIAAAHIDKLYRIHADDKGEPLKIAAHHEKMKRMLVELNDSIIEYQNRAEGHYNDVQRLASEEKWHNCPIDKCPNFPKILIAYQELIAKFEIFQIHATESRTRTNESMDRMADELFHLGQEVIAALRLQREAQNGNIKKASIPSSD